MDYGALKQKKVLSLILAVGLSWSHIRRRLTGQVDVDDLED